MKMLLSLYVLDHTIALGIIEILPVTLGRVLKECCSIWVLACGEVELVQPSWANTDVLPIGSLWNVGMLRLAFHGLQ